MRHLRPLAILVMCLLLGACTGTGETDATDGGTASTAPDDDVSAALASGFATRVEDAIAQQVADGVALNPLGRVLEECLVADLQALTRIGEGLDVSDTTPELLNVVVQDPDEDPVIQCAVKYGESSAGAVVLAAKATDLTPEEAGAELVAAGFVEIEDASAEGLEDDRVLLFDSTNFDATRVVWVGDSFQISLTANADIADTGALLRGLPIAVEEITRVLG